MKLLEAENELLKKRNDKNGTFSEYQINMKFKAIKYVINKYKLKNIISYLYNYRGASKSSYYNYLNNENKRMEKDRKEKILNRY